MSVSPDAATGYGRVTREVVSRLLDRHEVVCVGHVADVVVWGGKREVPLPGGRSVLTLAMLNPLVDEAGAAETVRAYVARYRPDVIVGHWDAFALGPWLADVEPSIPTLCYVPVDGPMTLKWANYIRDFYRIIAYSQFGYGELLKFFPPSKLAYIPHGVDVERFRPLGAPKGELRRELPLSPPVPEDAFVLLCVAANVGDRKKLPLLMRTFKRFAERHPDAHLVLWTNPWMRFGRGYDLSFYADILGVKGRVSFPTFNPILEAAPDEVMCALYNAADVYVSNSVAEGFCYPLLESMACGVPCIAPRNSAQVELVEGRGWLVENVPEDAYVDVPVYVPQLTEYPVPDQRDLLRKMEEAYADESLREEYGRKSREFALNYSWDRVMPLWFELLEEVEEEAEALRAALRA